MCLEEQQYSGTVYNAMKYGSFLYSCAFPTCIYLTTTVAHHRPCDIGSALLWPCEAVSKAFMEPSSCAAARPHFVPYIDSTFGRLLQPHVVLQKAKTWSSSLLTGRALVKPRPSVAFFIALIIGGGPQSRTLTSAAGFGKRVCIC